MGRIAALAVVLLCLSAAAFAAPSDARIASVKWTRSRDAATAVTSGKVTRGPIYLQLTVHGGKEALDELAAAGKLPIRAKWFWTSFGRSVADANADLIDAVNLTIGRPDKIRGLTRELTNRGYFDWRTLTGKQNSRLGRWQVKIVFADNTPVPCDPGVRCTFEIEVVER